MYGYKIEKWQEKREKIKLLSQTTDKPAEISAGLSVV